jgi:hypothetical protein
MIARCGYPMILLTLAACAGGTTMRVVEDSDQDHGPVALAPVPESEPESTMVDTLTAADTLTANSPDTLPAPGFPLDSAAEAAQAYAPYGGSDDLALRRIGQWTRTGINEARRLLIRDANSWAEFWSELGLGDRPAIDFSKDVVIAVAAGQRPTGGHEIAVKQVTLSEEEVAIKVTEVRPGPDCVTTTSLTQPVDVVVVPRVDARSWSFVEHQEVRGCQ